jgi:hypothetical protein
VHLALALWRGTGLEGLCERLLPIDVITWWSRDNGSDYDIRARLFNADGTAAGDDFVVNSTTRLRSIWCAEGAYGQAFSRRVPAMGIRDRPISPRQNPYDERLIGTL